MEFSSNIIIKFEISRHIFEKYSHIKFHENPSSKRHVVSCGQKDRRKHNTTMTKLIVAFRNF
jgi:hypothetical protein